MREDERRRGSPASKRDDSRDRARERARERHQNTGRSGGPTTITLPEGIGFFRPKAGKVDLNVVPFTSTVIHQLERPPLDKGEIWWRVRYKIHRNVGANNDTVICPTTVDRKCPICEERGQLFADNNKEEAKLLFPSWRNLILVEDPEEAGKLAVLDISEFAFWERLATHIKIAEDEGLEDVGTFYWPTGKGYTLRTWFEEKSFGAGGTFLNAESISFRERIALAKKLLTQADEVNIQGCMNIPTYDALRTKFLGLEETETKEETKPQAEETKPQATRTRSERTAPPQRRTEAREEKEEEEEEAPPPPAEPRRSRDGVPKKLKDNECPYNHTFGDDNDAYDDCRECNVWPACSEAYESSHDGG